MCPTTPMSVTTPEEFYRKKGKIQYDLEKELDKVEQERMQPTLTSPYKSNGISDTEHY